MLHSSCLIAGLARNLGIHVRYATSRINYLRRLFNSSDVIIYSNDNDDDTLYALSKEDYILLNENLSKKFHGSTTEIERYIDMAYYRNRYLDYIREYWKRYDFDYLIVLDTDVLGGYSYDGIANSVSYLNGQIGSIGSNSLIYQDNKRLYYDSLAYRRLNAIGKHSDSEINLLHYNRGEPLIQLQSCFGGLAIYNYATIYNSGIRYDEYDCDHVTLNQQLIELGYNVYLNPSMITLYSNSMYTRRIT